jgi:hypothetical protein
MPSIHVAMPVLFALIGWSTQRWLGLLFLLYGLMVFLGSVHLGWHYAVDGYMSVCVMLLVWRAVGWFVRRHMGDEPAGLPT